MSKNIEDYKKKLEELKKGRAAARTTEQIVGNVQTSQQPVQNIDKEEQKESQQTSQSHLDNISNQHQEASSSSQKKLRTFNLEMDKQVIEISIPPKEKIHYEREIQCDLEVEQQTHKLFHGTGNESESNFQHVQVEIENPDVFQNPHQVSSQIAASAHKALQQPVLPSKVELTGEDISHIVKSKNFLDFFNRSSRLIEKAITNKDDSNLYALIDVIGDKSNSNLQQTGIKSYLQHSVKLTDQQYGTNRVVTGIEWSPHRNDLVLASYSQNEQGNINDPVGLVALWSLSLKTRPEFYCFSQSQVTCVKYNPFQENLVLGGLYNGQIVLWDLRAKSTPIQRTTFTTGHSYPIYSLDVVGSVNAHNIISISNDGKLCVWNMNMLTQPSKTIDQLTYTPPEKTKQDINVTCMQFPQGDANNFYIGSEDGSFYRTQLHSKTQNNSQSMVAAVHAHDAPISSLSISHDPTGSHQLSGMVLTSSFDWTVKLWNPKVSGKPKKVLTFDCSEDYVYDVAWNPVNPSLFCCVDGEGYLDVWDLCEDIENPVYHEQEDKFALNKCRWSLDGSKVATGDSRGNLSIYNLDKKYLKINENKLSNIIDLYENKQ
ncbi:cytoplasmic dynein intermediate chain (macronuclear) [Tetrahymena thermophila SB210]|uniref:Cytoplasmic dynein intermediate chain n=1 Tax=Tetrahymena thermophila (strain SB210) TaxID=312017 RepID=I7LZH9_TETTS|nr:cytoplasmic dynein intermediate chain [Tetrahymena thermophila SB210]EAR83965.3 cytoplasmic dynein intermediate chain [Tetrahymena thermophila SB210]|eukprot:XP_001031628.3 cytoplasmic dynein intermediate chain [Tetrahymena thermophila SB210]